MVFVIVSKNLKPLLERLKPVFDQEIAQFAKERGWDARWKTLKADLNTKRVALVASLNAAIRNAFEKLFSK